MWLQAENDLGKIMSTSETVRRILKDHLGLDTADLSGDDLLFSSGRLDSLNSLRLLMALEEEFGISISPLDVSLEDVDSIDKITATIDRLKN